LCGDQQKSVAVDLQIACSTASKWHTTALTKLSLAVGTVPLPLVIAAQSWASGQPPAVRTLRAELAVDGESYVLLEVPKARGEREPLLTPAEREVAQLLIEGLQRREIADVRCTSTQTVASQLRGIFAKLQVGGRCALVKRAVETGWFE
jgi:DNA-binding NarL/FixJ family response regulator